MNVDGAVHLSICHEASLTPNADGEKAANNVGNELDVNESRIFFVKLRGEKQSKTRLRRIDIPRNASEGTSDI